MSTLGAETRTIAALAAPVAATQVATMFMGVVDTLMVARLGTEAIGATTIGSVWVFGTLVLAMGVLFGLDPIVSQAHGAGDGERAGRALQHGLLLALGLSVPLGLLWCFTYPVLLLLGQPPELARLAHAYTIVQLPSIPAFLGFTALRQYLSGRGIMAPALWVAVLGNVVNVVANWFFIFGGLGMAPRGVPGSGIATMAARVFMFLALYGIIHYRRLHLGAWTPWSRASASWRGLREVLRYGLPVGAHMALEVWAFHIATLLAGILGKNELAAHAIVINMASLSFMFPLGIAIAATTRVGNLLGARDPAGAARAARAALLLGAGVMLASATLFFLLRNALPRLWAPSPEVHSLAALLLPIAAAFQVFDGTQAVGCGVLRGRGDTLAAAWFNLIGYYLLALPLGWLLAFHYHLGIRGLWWGLTIGLMVVATLLVRRITTTLGT